MSLLIDLDLYEKVNMNIKGVYVYCNKCHEITPHSIEKKEKNIIFNIYKYLFGEKHSCDLCGDILNEDSGDTF